MQELKMNGHEVNSIQELQKHFEPETIRTVFADGTLEKWLRFLLVLLGRGANEISTVFGLNKSFGDILTGIILFFIIGSEFFINYEVHFRKGRKQTHLKAAAEAGGRRSGV